MTHQTIYNISDSSPGLFPQKMGGAGMREKPWGRGWSELYFSFLSHLSFFLSFFLFSVILHFHWNQTFFVSHIMWLMVIFILRGFLKSTRIFCTFKRQFLKSSILIRNVLMKMEGGLLFNFRLNEELKGFLPKMVLEKPSFALYLIYIYTWIEGQILERFFSSSDLSWRIK